MLKSEYDILKTLHDLGGGAFDALTPDESAVLDRMVVRGLVEKQLASTDNSARQLVTLYRITPDGRTALMDHDDELERDRKRRAYDEAQKERDRLQAEATQAKDRWFNLASAVIGAVVGSVATLLLQFLFK